MEGYCKDSYITHNYCGIHTFYGEANYTQRETKSVDQLKYFLVDSKVRTGKFRPSV